MESLYDDVYVRICVYFDRFAHCHAFALTCRRFARVMCERRAEIVAANAYSRNRNGYTEYFTFGLLHREEYDEAGDMLPAVVRGDGDVYWWHLFGKLCRANGGPTMESAIGLYWFTNEGFHRGNDEPAVIGKLDGSLCWYWRGRQHRNGDRPAVVGPEGREWWYNGEQYDIVDGARVLRPYVSNYST
jgi:hypothetical protein